MIDICETGQVHTRATEQDGSATPSSNCSKPFNAPATTASGRCLTRNTTVVEETCLGVKGEAADVHVLGPMASARPRTAPVDVLNGSPSRKRADHPEFQGVRRNPGPVGRRTPPMIEQSVANARVPACDFPVSEKPKALVGKSRTNNPLGAMTAQGEREPGVGR